MRSVGLWEFYWELERAQSLPAPLASLPHPLHPPQLRATARRDPLALRSLPVSDVPTTNANTEGPDIPLPPVSASVLASGRQGYDDRPPLCHTPWGTRL